DKCVRTTTYYAFMLFKAHRSKMALHVTTQDSSPLGLSVSASRGANEMVLSFVNPHSDADLHVDCSLLGSSAKDGTAAILHHPDLNACNTFDKPDTVVIQKHPVRVDGARVRSYRKAQKTEGF